MASTVKLQRSMSPVQRALLLGLAIAVLGVAFTSLPRMQGIEEDVGLDWLFHLRGPRPAPPEVVVVAIDQPTSRIVGAPDDPGKWPRTLHARLVDRLTALGARAIVFDIHFEEARSPEEDRRLADSIEASGRVILFEYLKRMAPGGDIVIERLVPPTPVLARAAAGIAPFPLPKVPAKVYQAWLFKTGAGDVPTLPVVAFQLHMIDRVGALCALLAEEAMEAAACGQSRPSPTALARGLRELFKRHPGLRPRLLARMGEIPEPGRTALSRLVALYSGPDSIYLDFYGPSHAITTIPYHRILDPTGGEEALIRGKTVFVGFSEQFEPEQRDGFFTVFSGSDGLDIAGVEIGATTFANLVEGRHIRPSALWVQDLLVATWGLAAGALLVSVSGSSAVIAALGLAGLWLGASAWAFTTQGLWPPVVIPLLFQLPTALVAGLLWRYRQARSERQRLHHMFGHFIPPEIVNALAKKDHPLAHKVEHVRGVCLASDVDQFTKVAERLPPDQLHELLNRYFETVFRPIRRYDGSISDVVGDAVMALWAMGSEDEPAVRGRACLAALAIQEAVDTFGHDFPLSPLPTRVGLHCGRIALGNVGAADHFEYRPVGDAVNAACRIEALNKHLGTRILASHAVIQGIPGLVLREVGAFRVVGKAQPLTVWELMGRLGQVGEDRVAMSAAFAEALLLFRRARWAEAQHRLRELLREFGEDGPARYYLQLVQQDRQHEPDPSWDGIINMISK